MPPTPVMVSVVLPLKVSTDDSKLPAAARPARSMATTTATPNAIDRTVSKVRKRSRNSGLTMRRLNNSHRARHETGSGEAAFKIPRQCGRPAYAARDSHAPQIPRCESPSKRWHGTRPQCASEDRGYFLPSRYRGCRLAHPQESVSANAPGLAQWRCAAVALRKAGEGSG